MEFLICFSLHWFLCGALSFPQCLAQGRAHNWGCISEDSSGTFLLPTSLHALPVLSLSLNILPLFRLDPSISSSYASTSSHNPHIPSYSPAVASTIPCPKDLALASHQNPLRHFPLLQRLMLSGILTFLPSQRSMEAIVLT